MELDEFVRNLFRSNHGTGDTVSDHRPRIPEFHRPQTPLAVSQSERSAAQHDMSALQYEMETIDQKYETLLNEDLDYLLPGYRERRDNRPKTAPECPPPRLPRPPVPSPQTLHRLSTPAKSTPAPRPEHGKACDARFRGWYGVRARRGPHYVLTTQTYDQSPTGTLLAKLSRQEAAQGKRGPLVYRYTPRSDARPHTSPTGDRGRLEHRRNSQQHAAGREQNSQQHAAGREQNSQQCAGGREWNSQGTERKVNGMKLGKSLAEKNRDNRGSHHNCTKDNLPKDKDSSYAVHTANAQKNTSSGLEAEPSTEDDLAKLALQGSDSDPSEYVDTWFVTTPGVRPYTWVPRIMSTDFSYRHRAKQEAFDYKRLAKRGHGDISTLLVKKFNQGITAV